jgi:hypothetical protein
MSACRHERRQRNVSACGAASGHHCRVGDAHQLGFDGGPFSPDFAVQTDPEFPADGDWSCAVIPFDRDGQVTQEFVSRWGAPRVLRVQPVGSPEWVGMFPAGGLGGLSGVFATPSPERICVIVDGKAYLVRVNAPGEGAVIVQNTVEQVVTLEDPALLLLVRGIDIVALGLGGMAWRSPRLAADGLRVVGADARGIWCVGDLLSEGQDSVVVDRATGLVASGPLVGGSPRNQPQ